MDKTLWRCGFLILFGKRFVVADHPYRTDLARLQLVVIQSAWWLLSFLIWVERLSLVPVFPRHHHPK